jgi:solute:Na+ symporter, SSS family
MMAMALVVPQRLVHLSLVDSIIIVFYFALVLAIGFYLKRQSNTSEDYFLAGRHSG